MSSSCLGSVCTAKVVPPMRRSATADYRRAPPTPGRSSPLGPRRMPRPSGFARGTSRSRTAMRRARRDHQHDQEALLDVQCGVAAVRERRARHGDATTSEIPEARRDHPGWNPIAMIASVDNAADRSSRHRRGNETVPSLRLCLRRSAVSCHRSDAPTAAAAVLPERQHVKDGQPMCSAARTPNQPARTQRSGR